MTANARRIAAGEGADPDVVTLAALLHELFNYPKGHPDSPRSGEVCAERARRALEQEDVPEAIVDAVAYAIRVHPYSLGVMPATLEARVLQDADRLDAIGAIGVARCFSVCGELGRPLYRHEDPWCAAREPDDRRWGVDHFPRKLLRIPESLHTATARTLAEERAHFMRAFLAQLGREIADS